MIQVVLGEIEIAKIKAVIAPEYREQAIKNKLDTVEVWYTSPSGIKIVPKLDLKAAKKFVMSLVRAPCRPFISFQGSLD